MTDGKMIDALNKQIGEELFSAYLYLAMSADFEAKSLPGFAGWMRAQAGEEIEHAMRIFTYISDRGGRAVMEAIGKPQTEWKSPLDAFQAAYDHERHISKCIDDLVTQASAANDFATESFLKWFVDEQVEEEKSADENVQKLKMFSDSSESIYLLDKELGQREKEED